VCECLLVSGERTPNQPNKMQTIKWTTAAGTALEVSISTAYLLNRQGVRKTSGELEVIIAATINGKSDRNMGVQTVTGHATCIAKIGNIGLTAETLAPITATLEAAKAEIAAHNAALDVHATNLASLGNGDINKMFGTHA
jgi:hypothetical protein